MEDKKIEAVKITDKNKDRLVEVYKQVFKGHPWHEDLICANSLRDNNDQKRCMMQYTRNACNKYDPNKKKNVIENDCNENYKKRLNKENREGIVLLLESGLEACVGCGDKLRLIEFYPDFADHVKLINEAIEKEGFIGYLVLIDNKDPIGFSWGYEIPKKRTISVNFPLLIPSLKEKGINPEEAFYGAEIGITDKFQKQGLGSVVSAIRIRDAAKKGYKAFLTRTINPFTHAIIEHIFSEKEGQHLLKDPERGSQWFKWDFEDFNEAYVQDVIKRLK